jgi:anti-sigma regulatory factor (Ser/Thr protein kinase)
VSPLSGLHFHGTAPQQRQGPPPAFADPAPQGPPPPATAAGDRLALPVHTSSVSRARGWVGGRIRDWGLPEQVSDTARLLVSELVTNAILHAGGTRVVVCLRPAVPARSDGARVRMEVVDEGTGPGRPAPRLAAAHEENGRGLMLLDALADRWGVERSAPGSPAGCTVWAEFGSGRGAGPVTR